jgi:uncharacterized protein (DUF433 family)
MSNETLSQLDLDDLIVSNPEILGGRRVFRNTRVPVEALFDNLAAGMSLDQILVSFKTLDKADVVRVLELMSARLAEPKAA